MDYGCICNDSTACEKLEASRFLLVLDFSLYCSPAECLAPYCKRKCDLQVSAHNTSRFPQELVFEDTLHAALKSISQLSPAVSCTMLS